MMDIHTIIRRRRILHAFLALISLIFIILFETGVVNSIKTEGKTAYYIEIVGVFATIAIAAVAVKVFAPLLRKCAKVMKQNKEKALRTIALFTAIQTVAIWITVLLNILVYYFANENTGLYCGLIAFFVALYLFPSNKRIGRLLHEEEEGRV